MVEIKHTISFAYPNGCARPTMGEMASFAKQLDSDPGDIDTMYRIAEEKSVFLKFKSEAGMQYTLTHNPDKLTFHYANGQSVEVQMSMAGGNVQYVRVFDLPPEVPDADVKVVLGKYGKIQRVIREKFPVELGLDIYSGVRGVYMDVEKEIPSSLNFVNRKGNIFYSGNKNQCFICKAEGHRMSSCPKRKVRKAQEKDQLGEGQNRDEGRKQPVAEQSGTSTYAGVVSDESACGKKTVEEVEVDQMEVLSSDSETGNGDKPSVVRKENPPKRDAEYYKKFDEEQAKRLVLWQEDQRKKAKELRAQQKAEAKLNSPPRKTTKNS